MPSNDTDTADAVPAASGERPWTPGPWAAKNHRVESMALVAYCGVNSAASATRSQYITEPEAKANARLIAAAPDLYEALAAAEEFIAACAGEAALAIYRQAHTALARARGEAA